MPTLIDTYTDQASRARQQYGDNPGAIRQGVASQMVQSSQPLQGAISGQTDAISAMAQADKDLAQKYQQTGQQAQQTSQNIGQGYQQAAQMGSAGATAQDTIAKAQAPINVQPVVQTYAQDTGLISPFVSSQMASGQVATQGQVYDLAAQQRGSLERAIGSEAENVANIAKYQMDKERMDREAELARQQAEEEKRRLEYEDKVNYAKLVGGTVINSTTGQTEVYKSAAERAREEADAKSKTGDTGILQKPTATGKTFLDLVTDGQGSFIDIIRQNPGLNENEILDLARANANTFGNFKESSDELRRMGLGIIADAGLNMEGKDAYLSKAMSLPGAAELINQGKDQLSREALAKQIVDAGSVDAYKQKMGITNQLNLSTQEEKDYRAQSSAKEVANTFLEDLDSLEEMTKNYTVMDAFNPQKQAEFNSKKSILTRAVARLFETGVLTDKDVEFYAKLVPQSFVGLQGGFTGQIEQLKNAIRTGVAKKGINPDQFEQERTIKQKLLTEAPQEVEQYRSQLQTGETLYYDANTGTYQAVGADEAPLPGFIRL